MDRRVWVMTTTPTLISVTLVTTGDRGTVGDTGDRVTLANPWSRPQWPRLISGHDHDHGGCDHGDPGGQGDTVSTVTTVTLATTVTTVPTIPVRLGSAIGQDSRRTII